MQNCRAPGGRVSRLRAAADTAPGVSPLQEHGSTSASLDGPSGAGSGSAVGGSSVRR